MLFVEQDLFHQFARSVVSRGHAGLDPFVKAFYSCVLKLQIIFQLLLHRLPDIDLEVVGHVGSTVEIQNPLHQNFRVLHFFDRFLAYLLCHPLIAPVFAHLGVKKILVDRREFGFQHFIQNGNDLGIAFHSYPLSRWTVACSQFSPLIKSGTTKSTALYLSLRTGQRIVLEGEKNHEREPAAAAAALGASASVPACPLVGAAAFGCAMPSTTRWFKQ